MPDESCNRMKTLRRSVSCLRPPDHMLDPHLRTHVRPKPSHRDNSAASFKVAFFIKQIVQQRQPASASAMKSLEEADGGGKSKAPAGQGEVIAEDLEGFQNSLGVGHGIRIQTRWECPPPPPPPPPPPKLGGPLTNPTWGAPVPVKLFRMLGLGFKGSCERGFRLERSGGLLSKVVRPS